MVGGLIFIFNAVIDRMHDDSIREALDAVRRVVGLVGSNGARSGSRILFWFISAASSRGDFGLAGRRQPQFCGDLASHSTAHGVSATNASLAGRMFQLKGLGYGDSTETRGPVGKESFD